MRSRQQAIADAIAKKIMANSKKRFSSLLDDAQREVNMSETTNNMTVDSQVSVGVIKQVDHNALVGSNQGDHRSPNTGAGITDAFKNAPGPRDAVRQAPLSGKQTPGAPVKSFLGADAVDQN
jgi:hypothetical protein